MTWIVYAAPDGTARTEHESLLFPAELERELHRGEDSGREREWAAHYNERLRQKRAREKAAPQPGLFGDNE